MSNKEKGNSVASGFFWRLSERLAAQGVSFVVSLILARLLAPEHYGTVAIVNIFISFANVIVTSGLGNSLIRKKDADELDFSTVFYANIALAAIIYTVVFLTAPLAATLYKNESITLILRVMGISLIISGFNNVQHAYVSKKMIFRRFFFATVIGTVISAAVGIWMAYCGFGVWALVAQHLINKTVDTVVLFITVRWRPMLRFSGTRLKGLFSYGWKLLASELINTAYLELRSMVISIRYSSADLAYYNKGQSFPKLLYINLNSSLQSVLFPKMSNVQDRLDEVKQLTRRAIRVTGYAIRPLILGIALVAEPFVRLLLTEKWLPCIPFLRIYCVIYIFTLVQTACLQVIKALGRSDIFLKLEILKKTVGIGVVIVTVPFGPLVIAVGAMAANVFFAIMNTIPTRKLLGYGYREQLADYMHGIVPLAIMIVACIAVGFLPLNDLLTLLLQVFVGAVVYIGASVITKPEAFVYLLGLAKRILRKGKKRKA